MQALHTEKINIKRSIDIDGCERQAPKVYRRSESRPFTSSAEPLVGSARPVTKNNSEAAKL